MLNHPDYHLLQQVYSFIAERPGFKAKQEFDLLLEFFTEINEDTKSGIKVDVPSKIIGKFGQHRIINVNLAPSVKRRDEFLKWVFKQIKV